MGWYKQHSSFAENPRSGIALMNEPKIKYKKVDNLVHGEVKEIRLIGEDQENKKSYFVFWLNHNDEHRSTHVSHKELFDWFKIDQAEFDNKFVKSSDLDEQLAK